jgi:Tol biopolymer transport system component
MGSGATVSFQDLGPGEARNPVWSPNGSGLLFLRFSSVQTNANPDHKVSIHESLNLFIADLATGETRALTDFEEGVTAQSVAVSPDGCFAVLEGPKLGGPYLSQSLRRHRNTDGSFTDTPISVPYTGLWLVDLRTGERELLMRDEHAMEVTPHFLPDGNRVLFQRLTKHLDPGLSDERPETDLALYDRAAGGFTLLTQVGRAYYPRLAPDGRTVAYARAIFPPDLWLMDTETVRRWQIDTGKRVPIEELLFSWTPDSRYVLFAWDGEVHAIGRTGRGPFRLTRGLGVAEVYGQGLSVHPDGKHVACATEAGDVVVAELDWSGVPGYEPATQ